MEKFKKFYLWSMDAKLFAGLWFMGITFIIGVIYLIRGSMSIDILTLVEVLGLSVVVSLVQIYLLGFGEKLHFEKFKCILLPIKFAVITLIFSLLFGWFEHTLDTIILVAVMAIGGILMIVGLKWGQDIKNSSKN